MMPTLRAAAAAAMLFASYPAASVAAIGHDGAINRQIAEAVSHQRRVRRAEILSNATIEHRRPVVRRESAIVRDATSDGEPRVEVADHQNLVQRTSTAAIDADGTTKGLSLGEAGADVGRMRARVARTAKNGKHVIRRTFSDPDSNGDSKEEADSSASADSSSAKTEGSSDTGDASATDGSSDTSDSSDAQDSSGRIEYSGTYPMANGEDTEESSETDDADTVFDDTEEAGNGTKLNGTMNAPSESGGSFTFFAIVIPIVAAVGIGITIGVMVYMQQQGDAARSYGDGPRKSQPGMTPGMKPGMPSRLSSGAAKGPAAAQAVDAGPSQPSEVPGISGAPPQLGGSEPAAKGGARTPAPGQKITLVVEVNNGSDMPSVNTFGGCDPFVEVRVTNGKPSETKGSAKLDKVPGKSSAKTLHIDKATDPVWNETIFIKDVVVSDDAYVQTILWDYSFTGNTAIGYGAVPLSEVIQDLDYDPAVPTVMRARECKIDKLVLDQAGLSLKAKVNTKMGYWEEHDYEVTVVSAAKLPKVDMIGSIDPYVEIRMTRSDPKAVFTKEPGPECLCISKTKKVDDCTDPKFDELIKFTAPADPAAYLQMIVWDEAMLGNKPVGQCYIKLSEILKTEPGSKPVEHKMKLSALPEFEPAADLGKAKLSFNVGYNICYGEPGKKD